MMEQTDLEEVPCLLCGSKESTIWGREHGYNALRCSQCRFVYVSPRPKLAAIDEAAHSGMHQVEEGTMSAIDEGFNPRKTPMFAERLASLFPAGELKARPLSWLDVGAGFGELIEAVKGLAHPDSRIMGIEPCRPKVEEARRRGIELQEIPLEEVHETFDVVSLINVLSHVPDPRQFVKELLNHVKPGGYVVLVTGNGADVEFKHYPDELLLPDHLCFFGESHLHQLLEECGLEIVGSESYVEFVTAAPAVAFFKNSIFGNLARNLYRIIRRRPTLDLMNKGPFRHMFVCARRK